MSRKTKRNKLVRKHDDKNGRLSAIRRRINKYTFLSFGLCVSSILTFIFLKTSSSAKIAGHITKFGDVELQYNTYQIDGISPLCGCWAEKKAEDWRGITFVARQLQIQREGVDPVTGYFLTLAFPDQIRWTPVGLFKLPVKIYSVVLPNDESFSPESLIDNQLPKSQKVIDERQIDATDFLMLVTKEGKLNVALLGETPLASWIPVKDAKTILKYESGMHLNSEGLASIEERYNEYPSTAIHFDNGRVTWDEYVEYPLGDFLGPNVVFWTIDKSAYLKTEKEILFNSREDYENSHRVIAIVIKESAFSVRVACQPFAENEIESHMKDSHGGIIIPRRVRDSGKVTVDISNPKSQASNFDEIYNFMKQHPTVAVRLPCACDMDNPKEITPSTVGFRYPPLPPNDGFNIFGPIGQLKLTSALGKILVGSRSFNIDAPSTLELRNIQSIEVDGGVISVPIQLKTGTRQANFQLRGTSEVYVNDESLNKKTDEYKPVTEYLMLLSAVIPILSFIATIGSIFLNRK